MTNDQIFEAVRDYIKDGRPYYNPFTKKAIYKNQKNWILWISKTIGKENTNKFLYFFEPEHFSIYSGIRLDVRSFKYNRRVKWLSYTPEEIFLKIPLKENKNKLKEIRKKENLIDLDQDYCKNNFHLFKNHGEYICPVNNKRYKVKYKWIIILRIFYTVQTVAYLSFLDEPERYSKHSGIKLEFEDYDKKYYKFRTEYTRDEKNNRIWTKYGNYKCTDEQKKILSIKNLQYFNSPEGILARKKRSEDQKRYNQSPEGIEKNKNVSKKMSMIMKEKIKNGTFTPNITNSWTHWDAVIECDGNIKKFRSSWEACFWFCNQNLSFESIRIDSNDRIYIIDFIDYENNILYEIKPKNRYNIEIDKMTALQQYCMDHHYKFIWVNENNIMEYLDIDKILSNPSAIIQYEKLKKSTK